MWTDWLTELIVKVCLETFVIKVTGYKSWIIMVAASLECFAKKTSLDDLHVAIAL